MTYKQVYNQLKKTATETKQHPYAWKDHPMLGKIPGGFKRPKSYNPSLNPFKNLSNTLSNFAGFSQDIANMNKAKQGVKQMQYKYNSKKVPEAIRTALQSTLYSLGAGRIGHLYKNN